ncbi:MAG TPA: PAS domain-containing sensor histidine kinase [Gemmatimonadaceae bacterium]|nr:PAS domain-containing sensor histidine kinase [Gemmatimonadaceae bacterium]
MSDTPPRRTPDHGSRAVDPPAPGPGGAHDAAAFTYARASGGLGGESAGLYKLLVESVTDYAIFALDPKGQILSWNAGAERMKGYKASEIVGQHFSTFYLPEDLAAGKPTWELEVASREGRFEDEGWRVRKDGTAFWANVVITALRAPTGDLVGFAKVTRDLTDRRRAEEELRDSEERFRLLVHGVRDYAIFMLDPDGRVASWNVGAERAKGYKASEIIGRHFSVFYPEELVAAGFPQHELEVAAQVGRFEDEGWRIRKDGTRFWANVVITALRDPAGRLVGYGKVTRDLTERRAAEAAALANDRRAAAAEAANQAKNDFLATMSHELRTPLNAIAGYVELLEMGLRGPITDAQREDLSRIRRSQQHLLGIINDILNYSRIEAKQIDFEIAPVPLAPVVDTVATMLEPQLAAKRIALTRACEPGALALADQAKVQQILINLLSNAVKFTPAGGRVSVTCAAGRKQVVLAVTDNGPGVPPEKREEIFEPFVQLGRSLTTGHEGTGLGLAISRDLARAMGGEVTYDDAPTTASGGGGARFSLTLPAA